jgi:hypothetical protein
MFAENAINAITTNMDSGRIVGNRFKGGTIALSGGPWDVLGNRHDGPQQYTFCTSAFSLDDTHDVLLRGNSVIPSATVFSSGANPAPAGRIARLVTSVDAGYGNVTQDNTFSGDAGLHFGDVVADALAYYESSPAGRPQLFGGSNAPEVILYESYQVAFEGRPGSLSSDGRILSVADLRSAPPVSGDVVAILTGPRKGEWYRIAQAIGDRQFLMDRPLPTPLDYDVSISQGFVAETIRGNTVDIKDQGGGSIGLAFTGASFGTRILGNRFVGDACVLSSAYSQEGLGAANSSYNTNVYPAPRDWTHLLTLDLIVDSNTFEDIERAEVTNGNYFGLDYLLDPNSDDVSKRHPNVGDRLYYSANIVANRYRRTVVPTVQNPVAIQLGTSAYTGANIHDASQRFVVQGNWYEYPTGWTAGPATIKAYDGTLHAIIKNDGTAAGRIENRTFTSPTSFDLPNGSPLGGGLLSAFGVFVGQDNADLAGQTNAAAIVPDGTQDLHLRVFGLPKDPGDNSKYLVIDTLTVSVDGGGTWKYLRTGTLSNWRVIVSRTVNTPVADLLLAAVPGLLNTRRYTVNVTYVTYTGAASTVASDFAVVGVTTDSGRSIVPRINVEATPGDYDGDGRSDLMVFRPSTAQWLRTGTGSNGFSSTFGLTSDYPINGDFDGDGRADLAVYRPPANANSPARWIYTKSSDGSGGSTTYEVLFGAPNDVPIPADFDGDGKTDFAIFRPSTAGWHISYSTGGDGVVTNFGDANLNDIPIPADYDGDRRADFAVFRKATAEWKIAYSGGGGLTQVFGDFNLNDIPVPGDYDGDGRADLAIFRVAMAEWIVSLSGNLPFGPAFPPKQVMIFIFGASGLFDIPVLGVIGALKKLNRI